VILMSMTEDEWRLKREAERAHDRLMAESGFREKTSASCRAPISGPLERLTDAEALIYRSHDADVPADGGYLADAPRGVTMSFLLDVIAHMRADQHEGEKSLVYRIAGLRALLDNLRRQYIQDVTDLRARVHAESVKTAGMVERLLSDCEKDIEVLRRKFEEADIERKSEVVSLPNWRARHRRVA